MISFGDEVHFRPSDPHHSIELARETGPVQGPARSANFFYG